jgi:hypothetical protein
MAGISRVHEGHAIAQAVVVPGTKDRPGRTLVILTVELPCESEDQAHATARYYNKQLVHLRRVRLEASPAQRAAARARTESFNAKRRADREAARAARQAGLAA